MSDFENWDNDPSDDLGHARSVARSHHSAPPQVHRALRENDMHRERRGKLLIAVVLLICAAVGLCFLLRL